MLRGFINNMIIMMINLEFMTLSMSMIMSITFKVMFFFLLMNIYFISWLILYSVISKMLTYWLFRRVLNVSTVSIYLLMNGHCFSINYCFYNLCFSSSIINIKYNKYNKYILIYGNLYYARVSMFITNCFIIYN